MTLIDTHCHLTEPPLIENLDGVLARAQDRGVERVLVPAYDRASWETVAAVASLEGVSVAFGLHPWAVGEGLDRDALGRALDGGAAIAVGEIGLDTKVEGYGPELRERQLEALRPQLELASERDLPVMLHCRGAHDDLIDELDRIAERRGRPLAGVVHAFSRSAELARRYTRLDLYISFAGTVTRPRARARRCAAELPLKQMLLETDAPSIALEGVRAEEVEPHHCRAVAEAVAELRGESLEEISRRTTANARALFRLD